jgi:hypothetical protein
MSSDENYIRKFSDDLPRSNVTDSVNGRIGPYTRKIQS